MNQATLLSNLMGLTIVMGGAFWLLHDVDTENPSKVSIAEHTLPQYEQMASAPLSSLQGEVLRLKKDMETLQNQLTHLKQEVEHGAHMLSALSASDNKAVEHAQDNESDQQHKAIDPQTAKHEAQQALAKIASSYENETIDDEWSSKSIEVMQQAFDSDELLDLSVLAMDCRSTLGTVEVQQNNATQQAALDIFFPMKVADLLPDITMHHTFSDNGETTTTMYLARNGYGLPDTQ